MNLLESGQDYLEAILELSETIKVRSIDVANHLGVTKQSAHRAIKNFKENNLVVSDEFGYLSLTKNGLEIAQKIYERHLVLEGYLMSLGVSKENACKDACKIEHDLSEESFQIIKSIYKKGEK